MKHTTALQREGNRETLYQIPTGLVRVSYIDILGFRAIKFVRVATE